MKIVHECDNNLQSITYSPDGFLLKLRGSIPIPIDYCPYCGEELSLECCIAEIYYENSFIEGIKFTGSLRESLTKWCERNEYVLKFIKDSNNEFSTFTLLVSSGEAFDVCVL